MIQYTIDTTIVAKEKLFCSDILFLFASKNSLQHGNLHGWGVKRRDEDMVAPRRSRAPGGHRQYPALR